LASQCPFLACSLRAQSPPSPGEGWLRSRSTVAGERNERFCEGGPEEPNFAQNHRKFGDGFGRVVAVSPKPRGCAFGGGGQRRRARAANLRSPSGELRLGKRVTATAYSC
jgi:hypothetical protein